MWPQTKVTQSVALVFFSSPSTHTHTHTHSYTCTAAGSSWWHRGSNMHTCSVLLHLAEVQCPPWAVWLEHQVAQCQILSSPAGAGRIHLPPLSGDPDTLGGLLQISAFCFLDYFCIFLSISCSLFTLLKIFSLRLILWVHKIVILFLCILCCVLCGHKALNG